MKLKKQSPAKLAYVIENSTAADWVDKQGVMERLPISSRALQKYRKQKLVPYAWLGGKIFYYISSVLKVYTSKKGSAGQSRFSHHRRTVILIKRNIFLV